jgi:predicted phage terminase large subunit-like protein
MVFMPPRHGKSELCCKYLPAWYLGTFPDRQVIVCGYGGEFASDWGRKSRDVMLEWGSLFGVAVCRTSAAAHRWRLEDHDGEMRAVGAGGQITGRGADLLIVDDPIKNAEEANSQVSRDKTWEWWNSTAYTRLEPRAAAIVIQTRWHGDDLCGRLLQAQADGGERWRVVKFPAIGDDGTALWPARYDLDRLHEIRQSIGEYWWSALYQQNPTPREGLFFQVDKLEIVPAEPIGLKYVRAWDAASSAGRGDYTAGVKLGRHADGTFYICGVFRGQWATDERNAHIKQTAELDGHAVKIRLPEDPGSAGVDVGKGWVRMLAGFNARAEKVTGSKELRADAFSAQVNAGNVKLVRGPWNKDFLEELRTFPAGTNDDQVDAASDAFNELTSTKPFFAKIF